MQNRSYGHIKEFGFTILCPERNIGGLRTTAMACQNHYQVSAKCIVGRDTRSSEIVEMSRYCPVIKGGKTITSLFDTGIKNSDTRWTMIVMAGSNIRQWMLNKYFYFARHDRDILYPVIDRKFTFDEASINGIMINKLALDEVGEFGDSIPNLTLAKLLWTAEAIKKGYTFKALVGVRFT